MNDKWYRDWGSPLLLQVRRELEQDGVWRDLLDHCMDDGWTVGVHLAVFVEPYLRFLLEGKKTVETRFSAHRCAPYERVSKGDLVFLKRSGGPICGICVVDHVWSYQLDPSSWKVIKNEFGHAICAQGPSFWERRESASFATLLAVRDVRELEPIRVNKRDRRGWVVLRPSGAVTLNLFTCDQTS